MLSPDEQALFKERIRFLDKKIHPGLKKLNWALKGASAYFITECRIHASKVGRGLQTLKVCKAGGRLTPGPSAPGSWGWRRAPPRKHYDIDELCWGQLPPP